MAEEAKTQVTDGEAGNAGAGAKGDEGGLKEADLTQGATARKSGDGKDSVVKKAGTDAEGTGGKGDEGELAKIALLSDEELDAHFAESVKNPKKAIAAATQRNQEIADERRAFEQEKKEIYQRMDAQIRQLQEMNNRMMQTYANPGREGRFEEGEEGGNSASVRQMAARMKQLEDSLGMMSISSEDARSHQALKMRYPDYDEKVVKETINKMNGAMDLNEMAFKAMQFDRQDVAGIQKTAFREGWEAAFKKMMTINKKSKEIRDPIKPGTSGGERGQEKPKSFEEAAQRAVHQYRGRLSSD